MVAKIEIRRGAFGGEQQEPTTHLLAPFFELCPGIVSRPVDLIEVIHASAAEMSVRHCKPCGFDDMGGHVHAGAKPKNRPGVLGDVGLEKRDLHFVAALLVRNSCMARRWSGFDIRYSPGREFAKRMSNPKLHQNLIFASGPLILTFAKVPAATGCEC